jgi:hypothetical protein
MNIRPIKDVSRNTAEIAELCYNSNEPVFITKNGYGNLVMMSQAVYDKIVAYADFHYNVMKSHREHLSGQGQPADEVFAELLAEYRAKL